jgi:hypothetical protein
MPGPSWGGTTWTGDFKCREVKTALCRNRRMQTGSSGTLIGWKSCQTTFVPLWDRMEGAWLRTLDFSAFPVSIAAVSLTGRQTWQNVNSKRRLQRIKNVQEGKIPQNKQTSSCFCLCFFCFWEEVSNSWILNDISRNLLLGSRKKIS